MKESFDILKKCPLFSGFSEESLIAVLGCLGARIETYEKDTVILTEGDPAKYLGIILSGEAQIVRIDYYGNRSIVAYVDPPQIFGESSAYSSIEIMPVSVIASARTRAMLIEAGKITMSCSNACSFHSQMILNLLKVVADKNLVFHQKLEITSKRSTREKLMTYLLQQAKKNNSNHFVVPYDRQELADYLEVERSGLSAEISKLRSDGVLLCHKSEFTLL